MKIKLIKILSSLVVFALLFTSCVTTKTKEVDPNYLADMDPFEVGEALCWNKNNFFKAKKTTLSVEFIPRTSGVAFYFKDGMNKVYLQFSKDDFNEIDLSARKYVEMYEENTLDPNHKPKVKNRFYKGSSHISWGAVGLGRDVEAPFDTNYEWLEIDGQSNPYFRIEVKATSYPEETLASSG